MILAANEDGSPIAPKMTLKEEEAARRWWAEIGSTSVPRARAEDPPDKWGAWGVWSSHIEAFLAGYRAAWAAHDGET